MTLDDVRQGIWEAHHWVEPWLPIIDATFNGVVVFLIAYMMLIKGLSFNRLTELGRRMGENALWFSLAYFAVVLSIWIVFFREDPWRYFIRFAILFSAFRVLLSMSWAAGGWKALHRRAWCNAMRRLHLTRFTRCDLRQPPGMY